MKIYPLNISYKLNNYMNIYVSDSKIENWIQFKIWYFRILKVIIFYASKNYKKNNKIKFQTQSKAES